MAAAGPDVRLGVLNSLITRLDEESVSYCHWKGNHSLPAVLEGEKDFELLVDEGSLPLTEKVLHELGYRLGEAPYAAEPRGVAHYFSRIAGHERLSHVHLYSRVVTGEKLVVNHHLPLESEILGGSRWIDGVRQTDRSTELVVFAIRGALLRTSPIDALFRLRERDRRSQEWRWLQQNATDVTTAVKVIAETLSIDSAVLGGWVDAIDSPGSRLRLFRPALDVRRELRPYRIHGRVRQAARQVDLVAHAAARRVMRRPRGKRLESGGRVIAIVGPDASGKSTTVAATARWLGEHFEVRSVHAGKPPTSLLTMPVNALSVLLRRTDSELKMAKVEGHAPSATVGDRPPKRGNTIGAVPPTVSLTRLLFGVRSVATAWDRRRLLERVRRQADSGSLVICDRYPSDHLGAMDSPRLPRYVDAGNLAERLADRLARLEHRIYGEIPAPDFVISLTVPLEKALARNDARDKWDKENADYVASRHRSAVPWSRHDCPDVSEVNTGGSLPDTLEAIRAFVWARL